MDRAALNDSHGPLLAGSEKVAALLYAMGKPLAGRVMKHFGESDLRRLTQAAAALQPLHTVMLEALVDEFSSFFKQGADVSGSPANAQDLLSSCLTPEKVSDMMSDVLGGPRQSIWERVALVPEAALVAHLGREHPQVVTIILDKLGPAASANLLVSLPDELRASVARRIITAGTCAEPAMRLLEASLEAGLLAASLHTGGNAPETKMLNIVNKLEREQMDNILDVLGATNPAAVEKIRSKLFNFEDIASLPLRSRSVLFDKIPTERLIIALKGSDQALCDAVLSSLAARARRMVEQELKDSQSVPSKEINAARRAIAQTVVELAGQGVIELSQPETAQG